MDGGTGPRGNDGKDGQPGTQGIQVNSWYSKTSCILQVLQKS